MSKSPERGEPAPAITLPDQDGVPRSLADHHGSWVLVYFYPRDDTPGCTAEACGLRDAASEYAGADVHVLGISADTVKSHRKFAEKFRLPFTLLADEEKRVVRAYGAWGKKKFMGREFDGILRKSFLIDPRGKVAKVYPKVKPDEHAAEVLADVQELAGGSGSASPRAAAPARPRKGKPKATKTAPGNGKPKGTRRPRPGGRPRRSK